MFKHYYIKLNFKKYFCSTNDLKVYMIEVFCIVSQLVSGGEIDQKK